MSVNILSYSILTTVGNGLPSLIYMYYGLEEDKIWLQTTDHVYNLWYYKSAVHNNDTQQ